MMGKHFSSRFPLLVQAAIRFVQEVNYSPFSAAICGAILCTAGCDVPHAADFSQLSDDVDEPAVLKVNAVRVELSEEVMEESVYFGTLQPRRTSTLSFARGGQVREITKAIGDVVTEGDQLAALEQRRLESQLNEINQLLTQRRDELDRLARRVNATQNQRQLAQRREEINTLDNQRIDVESELQNGIIVSPYDAMVAERYAEAGDSVSGGRPVIRVVEDAPPNIELDVALKIAEQIDVDQVVDVMKGNQSARQARVTNKSPEVNRSSRTQRVMLALLEDEGESGETWLFGDVVELRFLTPTQKLGYWLPYSALHREADGLWSVYVVRNENDQEYVERRTLELLQLDDDHALVGGALQDGDLVIVDGSHRIVPGQQVISRDVTSQEEVPVAQGDGE